MKRFLKPTGQILTTAAFTSAALETFIPNTAVPASVPDSLPPDVHQTSQPEHPYLEIAQTVIPPEDLIHQEFTYHSESADSQLQVDVDVPSLAFDYETSPHDFSDDLAETAPSLPPITFKLTDIPEIDESTSRISQHQTHTDSQNLMSSSAQNQPIPSQLIQDEEADASHPNQSETITVDASSPPEVLTQQTEYTEELTSSDSEEFTSLEELIPPTEPSSPEGFVIPVELISPDELAIPVESSSPDELAMPVESGSSDELPMPMEPSSPEGFVIPVELISPDELAMPAEPSSPDELTIPVESGSSDELPMPMEPSSPEGFVIPVELISPDELAMPAEPSSPDELAIPVELTSPDEFISDELIFSEESTSQGEFSPTPSMLGNDIDATREWLDETLARIVNRDRLNRENQFRENLIGSAYEFLSHGNVEQAKRIAENSALTKDERDELLVAIAEAEENSIHPFVSAEHALLVSTRSSSHHQPVPSREWLLTQMDRVVVSSEPSCRTTNGFALSTSAHEDFADASLSESLNSDSPINSEAQRTGQGGSSNDMFLSGGAFLAGVGHQPPSTSQNHPPLPVQRTTVQQSRTIQSDDCAPTLGQNIGGLTVATLSGYEWLRQFDRSNTSMRMVLPLAVPAAITSHFGWRNHPIYGGRRFHFGVDFGAPMGTPVLAALPGRVETSNYLNGYGLTVILENQDMEQRTLYAHMSAIAVPAGTWVEQGDIIGWVGSTGNSTGPHLHFEVHKRQENEWVAVDPLEAAAQLIADRRGARP